MSVLFKMAKFRHKNNVCVCLSIYQKVIQNYNGLKNVTLTTEQLAQEKIYRPSEQNKESPNKIIHLYEN